jgi:hypothetical protein
LLGVIILFHLEGCAGRGGSAMGHSPLHTMKMGHRQFCETSFVHRASRAFPAHVFHHSHEHDLACHRWICFRRARVSPRCPEVLPSHPGVVAPNRATIQSPAATRMIAPQISLPEAMAASGPMPSDGE